MARTIAIAVILSTLVGVNYQIWHKESILKHGERVYVQLAPLDPRSLIQGDYMALNYRLPSDILKLSDQMARKGYLVGELNDRHVLEIKSIFKDGQSLAPNQRKILYRIRGGRFRSSRILIGSPSYFFQEGQGKFFDHAKYGELRIDKNGQSILVGLRDKDFVLLGPKVKQVPAGK